MSQCFVCVSPLRELSAEILCSWSLSFRETLVSLIGLDQEVVWRPQGVVVRTDRCVSGRVRVWLPPGQGDLWWMVLVVLPGGCGWCAITVAFCLSACVGMRLSGDLICGLTSFGELLSSCFFLFFHPFLPPIGILNPC